MTAADDQRDDLVTSNMILGNDFQRQRISFYTAVARSELCRHSLDTTVAPLWRMDPTYDMRWR